MWLNIDDGIEDSTVNIAGFCSGTGMLEEAVAIALRERGLRTASILHCEREASAASAIVGIEKASGNRSAIWDDIATFNGSPWRGVIDIAVAGLPCPAYSQAGKRRGNEDDRAWGSNNDGPQPHFLRIVREMRPAVVFLENVPPWVRSGSFQRFGESLSGMGFRIQDPLEITAKSIGAPHKRERVFVLAYSAVNFWESWTERERLWSGSEELANTKHGPICAEQLLAPRERQDCSTEHGSMLGPNCSELANGNGDGPRAGGRGRCVQGAELATSGEAMANTNSERSQGRGPAESSRSVLARSDSIMGNPEQQRRTAEGDIAPIQGTNQRGSAMGNPAGEQCERVPDREDGERFPSGRSGLPFFPPRRSEFDAWETVAGLDPSRMPAIESGIPMVADGLAFSTSSLLRLGGNGVVTLEAAIAFEILLSETLASIKGN